MKKNILTLAAVALMLLAAIPPARADKSGVVRFATLPVGPGNPEGIAADAKGNIYVATFDFIATNVIHIFSGNSGQLVDTIPLPGAVPLGLAFDTAGNLYVANFGGGTVLKYAPPFNASSVPAATYSVCAGFPTCALNAMTFDAGGDLYVSDSFGGNIFKIDLPAGIVSTFATDPLLTPGSHGFPPFGANGLAFSPIDGKLYVANTADDRILRVDPVSGAVDPVSFAESINGADGILFDSKGRLWVAANQADEIVALDGTTGRVVARRGSFDGIGTDGAAKGLIFPASIVLSKGSIYVTNAALVLTPPPSPSEPEKDVTTFTISRIPLGGK